MAPKRAVQSRQEAEARHLGPADVLGTSGAERLRRALQRAVASGSDAVCAREMKLTRAVKKNPCKHRGELKLHYGFNWNQICSAACRPRPTPRARVRRPACSDARRPPAKGEGAPTRPAGTPLGPVRATGARPSTGRVGRAPAASRVARCVASTAKPAP